MGRLVIIEGTERGKIYPLGETTLIGRLKSNHITVKDSKTSRKNSKITRRGEAFYIEDLQSSNGTFVNGEKRVGRVKLSAGDELTIGKVSFRFEPGAPKGPPAEGSRKRPRPRPAPAPSSSPAPRPSVATMETPPSGVPAKPPKAAPPRDVATMATPPSGTPSPSVASMETPPSGSVRPGVASMETPPGGMDGELDEISLEDPGGGLDEIVLEGAEDEPVVEAPPPRPVPAPSPPKGPSRPSGPEAYDLTGPSVLGGRKKAGLFSEDVGQRDWRFQWIIALVIVVIMAAVFYAAFKLSTSL